MLSLPSPRHMPCEHCGRSLRRSLAGEHVCDEERRLDYAVFLAGGGLRGFDDELSAWLDTPAGRFAQFDAARGRRSH
jgi:hypothetical protein